MTKPLLLAQQINSVSGNVTDEISGNPISRVEIRLVKTSLVNYTDTDGNFKIYNLPVGENILQFISDSYLIKKIPVTIDSSSVEIDLGQIRLTEKNTQQEEHYIMINEDELYSDSGEASNNITGVLSSSKDVFLRTVAFEFSQAFFKPRGLGSEFRTVMLNGTPMNKIYNSRPQWSNWGGLNDVFRNQVDHNNLTASEFIFSNLAGSINLITQRSSYRKGLKASYASSNRSYQNRLMMTYNSGAFKNNWFLTFSTSYRFANQGYREGTPYKALSFFTAVEKKFNKHHSLNITTIYANNFSGKSAPLTQEVLTLKNKRYNSYWGMQESKIRNSRVKRICEPIFQLNHFWDINASSSLQTGLTYQFGKTGNSRLDYGGGRIVYDTEDQPYLIGGGKNPYPDYYQNLPSYFLRNPENPDYSGAYLAEQAFLQNGQVNWENLYAANQTITLTGGNSIYALYEDRNDDRQFTFNSIFHKKINPSFDINAAVRYQNLQSENFGNLLDLLGGKGFLDVDIYEDDLEKAQNDLQDPNRTIKENERFKYNYKLSASNLYGFIQTQYHTKRTDAFVALNSEYSNYQRNGLFENGAYPGNASLGKSEKVSFFNFGIKTGVSYKLSGWHLFSMHTAYLTKAPVIQNTFSNIRENNELVENLNSEKHFEADLNYWFRHPKINAKLSTYFISLKDQTHIGFYFADGLTGLDFAETTAFVQEILTRIDKQNFGLELGIEIPVLMQWKIKGVAAIGQSVYTSNPDLYLTSDSFQGHLDYGKSFLKNYFTANGPQQAYSMGFEYNSSNYWWFSATANYFKNAYINIAPITRTANFYKNSDGMPISNYDEEIAKEMLRQEKFKAYTLINLVGGKSWKVNKYYIGFFASIGNLLNTDYKTGGFEQSRNANYNTLLEDKNREKPLFGPKYWMGYGTTYYTSVYFRW